MELNLSLPVGGRACGGADGQETGSSRILAVDDSTNPNCKFMYLQGDVKTTTKYFNKIDTRNLHYAIND